MAVCLLLLGVRISGAVMWFPVGPDGGDARAFAADPKDHQHLFMGTTTGWVYESHDGGASWRHLARVGLRDDLIIDNIVVDSANPNHILVGAWVVDRPDGGLFQSSDAGKTWVSVHSMQGQSIRSLAQSASNPGIVVAGTLKGVYRSQDVGKTWALMSPEGSRELHEVESIAIDPQDPNTIYAGTWHLPWKTTDGGEHWHNIKQGVIDDSDVFSIIVDPRSPSTVYASACSGIYKSENAGELFHKVQGIPSTARRTRVLMQDPKQPQTVFAGTTEGLWRTADAGATWLRTTAPDVIVNDVYVDPGQTDHVLLATDRGGVLASIDGGFTFKSSNKGFSARQITSYAADARNPALVYVGVVNDKQLGGVFSSSNGGLTWGQLSDGLEGHDVFSLVKAADGSIVAGTNQGIYRLTGDQWIRSGNIAGRLPGVATGKPVPTLRATARPQMADRPQHARGAETGVVVAGSIYALARGDDQLYAATSQGLLTSLDSGMTWRRLTMTGAMAVPADWRYMCAYHGGLAVADPTQIAVSFDNGRNWKHPLLPRALTGVLSVALDGNGGIWIGGREGLFFSTDQGDHWNPVPNFSVNNINSLFYDAALRSILVTAGNSSTMAFAVNTQTKSYTLWETEWNLRFVRPLGDHLIGATLFDGMVLQPRMVASP